MYDLLMRHEQDGITLTPTFFEGKPSCHKCSKNLINPLTCSFSMCLRKCRFIAGTIILSLNVYLMTTVVEGNQLWFYNN